MHSLYYFTDFCLFWKHGDKGWFKKWVVCQKSRYSGKAAKLKFNWANLYSFETGDQPNLEVEVHIHQGTRGLVADTDCLDPEVVIQVSLLVHWLWRVALLLSWTKTRKQELLRQPKPVQKLPTLQHLLREILMLL